MDSTIHRFFAPCPRGLEPVLAEELRGLGAQSVTQTPGGIGFTGPFTLCYRANLDSRIASRMLWRICDAPYHTEQDIYEAASAVRWEDWISSRRTIKVKVSAQHCPLKSLDFVTLRIKDAVCDRFRAIGQGRPGVETRQPDVRIDAFLDRTTLTLYLDTSGEPLFKRGLRQSATEAPLRENLAAGILKFAGWTPEQVLLDPMCGGGTIPMEAAMMARDIAPGLGRHFAFERLQNYDGKLWSRLCEDRRAQQRDKADAAIFASDRDAGAVRVAEANLKASGLAGSVRLAQADILALSAPADTGLIVTNPPYGVRIGDEGRLAAFYPRLGDALKRRFPGWTAYLFSGDLRLPKLIGLAPSRRIPLFNGALECRMYEFKLVRGTNRRKAVLPAG
ncbi:MAG: THUMP domain-containing protein [Nitrospirota bacterium]